MMATTFVAGAAFGGAMAAAGFYDPGVVIAQLNLQNWHMVQAFLTALAASSAYASPLVLLHSALQFPC